jgi:hypothetical protein
MSPLIRCAAETADAERWRSAAPGWADVVLPAGPLALVPRHTKEDNALRSWVGVALSTYQSVRMSSRIVSTSRRLPR